MKLKRSVERVGNRSGRRSSASKPILMRRIAALVTLCAALVVPAAPAGQAPGFDETFAALIDRLERAYVGGDGPELLAVRADLTDLLDTGLTAGERSVTLYTVAYVSWRLFTVPDAVPADDRAALLDDAVDLLTRDLEADDGNAESHALLASVYGMQIDSAWKGMTLGRRASRASARALELAPGNPRVLLQDGVGKLHTPGMFGGGADRAEAMLLRALAAFRTEPPDRPWPRWGLIDTHAWLGQISVERDDLAAARRHYEQALDLEPGFAWVRYALLPALEERARQER
ncbi:MAG: hypothetical protein OXG35_15625 [Acidobacteria bacterium]|nr:hypothetical protein [Acidobacteriota bacterium]